MRSTILSDKFSMFLDCLFIEFYIFLKPATQTIYFLCIFVIVYT